MRTNSLLSNYMDWWWILPKEKKLRHSTLVSGLLSSSSLNRCTSTPFLTRRSLLPTYNPCCYHFFWIGKDILIRVYGGRQSNTHFFWVLWKCHNHGFLKYLMYEHYVKKSFSELWKEHLLTCDIKRVNGWRNVGTVSPLPPPLPSTFLFYFIFNVDFLFFQLSKKGPTWWGLVVRKLSGPFGGPGWLSNN